jgi:peptidoglycan/LPS O-acetylase OafA/YrhL
LNHAGAPIILLALMWFELKFALKWDGYYTWGYYLAYFLNSLLILSLLDRKSIVGMSRKVDAFVGDLSYPIYLMHLPAGLVLIAMGFRGAVRGQPRFFYTALPIILLLAWALAQFVERPIESIRRRIKARRALEKEALL